MADYSLTKIYESSNRNRLFNMIDNYIYLHHLNTYILLPLYPEEIRDSQSARYSSSTPLMRSAPIQSYSDSSARTIDISFSLHRELMTQINYRKSNAVLEIGDDYIDTLVKHIQACAVPKYSAGDKMVDPPLVSLRIGDDIFIKGIISSGPVVSYGLPIIHIDGKDKYARVTLSFGVTEVDPYGADEVAKVGSFRGLSTSLERNLWKYNGSLSGKMSKIRG